METFKDNTFRGLISGVFNMGLFAIRRCPRALEFLTWWNRKLQQLCYMEWRSRGLFVDQKWVLLGLSFFDFTVLREPGYNVANWNVGEREITLDPVTSAPLAKGKPLRCFHFSGIDSGSDVCYFSKYLDRSSPVFAMRRAYLEAVARFDVGGISRSTWSYDRFVSGEKITSEVRYLYRNSPALIERFPGAFKHSADALFLAAAEPQPPSVIRLVSARWANKLTELKSIYGRWRSALRADRAYSKTQQ